jgi:hypothetical protein
MKVQNAILSLMALAIMVAPAFGAAAAITISEDYKCGFNSTMTATGLQASQNFTIRETTGGTNLTLVSCATGTLTAAIKNVQTTAGGAATCVVTMPRVSGVNRTYRLYNSTDGAASASVTVHMPYCNSYVSVDPAYEIIDILGGTLATIASAITSVAWFMVAGVVFAGAGIFMAKLFDVI